MTSRQPNKEYRNLPSVDELLKHDAAPDLLAIYPRKIVTQGIREALEQARAAIASGEKAPGADDLMASAVNIAKRLARRSLRRVINATGIIIHTGLGRSMLCDEALAAISEVAENHSNLEIDVESGKRGSRQRHVEKLLIDLTGAEAAMVVNNNAAAVFLAVNTIANGQEVIISRGQLVEIGGSFRMPDVIERAGGRMVEVGTTNRTRISDYDNAVHWNNGMILRCHPSNYKVCGFTEEASLRELVELGNKVFVPVMDDLGSGALVDVSEFGLEHEPTVQESIEAGADIVSFSGDKMLGAAQAGILVGKAEYIDSCRSNSLARALRVDKLTLAALEATLRVYRYGDPKTIPTLAAISRPLQEIEAAAKNLADNVNAIGIKSMHAEVILVDSEVGGGSLPGKTLESRGVALKSDELSAEDFSVSFRGNDPPIFGRIVRDVFVLDMRTVRPDEITDITGCVGGLIR